MTRDEAVIVLRDAAAKWLNELYEYIIPGEASSAMAEAYEDQADKIARALYRINN